MESNDKLKETDIKNRTCYYFDGIVKIEDFDLDNLLIYEKSFENILVFNIFYKILIAAKPFCIRFNQVDGFNMVYDGSRYLLLFEREKYDFTYNRVRYLVGVKSSTTCVIFHNYAKIKVDSNNSLPLEETMAFHNVIILIKTVWKKY